ncbi:MAG: phenylalanine--tRNA ligase subunit beta [Chitinophagales bacterium]|nr:phenylalanine--tRNA ligase subunit beta [Chitinophagales bacterium]
MKISYRWLKQYADLQLPADQLADLLTDVGLEVESWENWSSVPGGLKGLVVGEVIEVSPHPRADRLRITRVRINHGDPVQIVCGAPNVAVGQKVVVALPGTTLHTASGKLLSIEQASIRGVESFGMICAEDEIGIGTAHEGILVLPADAPAGMAYSEYFGVEQDEVFTIGLTPNRGDAMSHLGVARDVVAAVNVRYGKRLSLHQPDVSAFHADSVVSTLPVTIHNLRDCIRYCGLVLTDVRIQASPQWLQSLLQRIGLKPVNNIVDVTNYVMWECGQPLHAFDADRLPAPAIEVGNLPSGTSFETLDGNLLHLHEDDLMICSGGVGLCIAGVYGGKNSGVTDSTCRVFLESAIFRPEAIRRTSLRHRLRTDAALHFEKSVDPSGALYALKRAALLIAELAGGRYSEPVDVNPQPIGGRTIVLPWSRLDRLAGKPCPRDEATAVLADLGFHIIANNTEALTVTAPTAKADVRQAQDVMEEILRISGLDRIPAASRLSAHVPHQPLPESETLQRRVADFLTANGFNEIINNSITTSSYARLLAEEPEGEIVRLLGSANAGLDSLRTDLVFSGLEVVAHNLNRQQTLLRLFELGHSYKWQNDRVSEVPQLAMWFCGHQQPEGWLAAPQEVGFFDAKGYLETLWRHLGLPELFIEPFSFAWGEGIQWSAGRPVAWLGRIRRRVLQHFDIDRPVWYASVSLEALETLWVRRSVQFRPLPRFPAVRRDLALIVGTDVSYQTLSRRAAELIPRHLTAVNLFDVYADERLGSDRISYALSFVFQHEERTLTDREVDAFMEKLIRTFEQELHAVVRR